MKDVKLIVYIVLWCILTAILVSRYESKVWQARLDLERSVEWVDDYGARGNGIDDDSNIIQLVIDVAKIKHRGVAFGDRVYRVENPIVIYGGGSTIKYYGPTPAAAISLINVTDIKMENICIEGFEQGISISDTEPYAALKAGG